MSLESQITDLSISNQEILREIEENGIDEKNIKLFITHRLDIEDEYKIDRLCKYLFRDGNKLIEHKSENLSHTRGRQMYKRVPQIPQEHMKTIISCGYLLTSDDIYYMIRYYTKFTIINILDNCEIKLTEADKEICFERQYFTPKNIPDQKFLEKLFKYNKANGILKDLKRYHVNRSDLKINQTCLRNACYVSANLAGIKVMLKKYELKLDEVCLTNALTHKTNTALISFLLESGVKLTQEAFENLMICQKKNPACDLILKYMWDMIGSKESGEIEGVEDI